MASKYSQIPAGKIFEAKGGKFRKLDEMYYEDLQTGFQAVWNPMFDDTIATAPPAAPPPAGAVNTTDKFLVDQQTRMMTPNPNYRESLSEAEKVFAEMWGTALFDCGPEDYEYMALQSIKAVNLVGSILMILESVDTSPVTSDQIEGILNKWADRLFYTTESPKPKKKAPAKKKPVKKAPPKKKPVAKKKGKK